MNDDLLTAAERRIMLEEIGRVALATGREMYGDAAFPPLETESGGSPGLLSGRERLALLESAFSVIERAVRQIAAAPRTALRTEVRERPAERVKRPAQREIPSVLRRYSPPHTSSAFIPPLLPETALLTTVNTPENRYVTALLREWQRDLRFLRALAEWEEETPLAARAAELEARLRRLETIESREPEDESDPLRHPLPGARLPTDAALRDPRYRALHDVHRRYRRLLGYAWDAPALLLPPRETWRLYEMWCFFRVVAALRALGSRAQGGDAVQLRQSRLSIMLEKGQASRLEFQVESRGAGAERRASSRLSTPDSRLLLFYNRAFPSAAAGSRETVSRTHMMIPDICLEYAGRLLLLDPKYHTYSARGEEPENADMRGTADGESIRIHRALYDDLNRMHAYRDAIVRDGQPVVDGAWCLYPGGREEGEAVIAYPASTRQNPFGTAGIGAIRLRPGQPDRALARLIVDTLRTPSRSAGARPSGRSARSAPPTGFS
jgi:hypothetical protein